MRGIFHNLLKRDILQDVQSLILDGLAVPVDLVTEIITQESFNVRILSIRDVQHLNERKLQQALLYAIRPSRPANTPKLQGLYLFGPKDASIISGTYQQRKTRTESLHDTAMPSQGAQIGAQWNAKSEGALAEITRSGDKWFERNGKLFLRQVSPEWAEVMQACHRIISFDAVLCSGPRHSVQKEVTNLERSLPYTPPRVATHALDGCSGCGGAPEGLSRLGHSNLDRFPLLAPPALHSSTPKAAKTPSGGRSYEKSLLVRCSDCLRTRYCERCHKWWCERCYDATDDSTSNKILEGRPVGATSGKHAKVHMGLCVESCLVSQMILGAKRNRMWS